MKRPKMPANLPKLFRYFRAHNLLVLAGLLLMFQNCGQPLGDIGNGGFSASSFLGTDENTAAPAEETRLLTTEQEQAAGTPTALANSFNSLSFTYRQASFRLKYDVQRVQYYNPDSKEWLDTIADFAFVERKIGRVLGGNIKVVSNEDVVAGIEKALMIGPAVTKSGQKCEVIALNADTVSAFQSQLTMLGLESSIPVSVTSTVSAADCNELFQTATGVKFINSSAGKIELASVNFADQLNTFRFNLRDRAIQYMDTGAGGWKDLPGVSYLDSVKQFSKLVCGKFSIVNFASSSGRAPYLVGAVTYPPSELLALSRSGLPIILQMPMMALVDRATFDAFRSFVSGGKFGSHIPAPTVTVAGTTSTTATTTTTSTTTTATTGTASTTGSRSPASTDTTPPVVNPLTMPNTETFSSQFSHPGLINSQDQLNRFRWAANDASLGDMAVYFSVIANDSRGDSGARATPYATVGNTEASRLALLNDASIAYLNALRWVKSGNQNHANAAIRALNDWANTFQTITDSGSGSSVEENLNASWALPMWLNAAEIIRYHNNGTAGWSSGDIQRFNDNFVNKLYNKAKLTLDESTAGGGTKYESNWAASAALTAMSVGVFQNNVDRYKLGLSHIKRLMPILILEAGDYTIVTDTVKANGNKKVVKGFQRDGTVQEMIAREDCGHPQYSLRALTQAAITAANQGDYSLLLMTNSNAPGMRPLLLRGLEYMADSATGLDATYRACPSAKIEGATHVAFNTYGLLGVSSTKMQSLVQKIGAEGQDQHFIGWSSATSYAKRLPSGTNAYCARGILSKDGISCCPAACGRCGGDSCESRPGGANACCTGRIQAAQISCANHEAPCALTSGFLSH